MTPSWREAHFEVKMYKAPQCRTAFGSWDVEKVHAVVAGSTFRSQNAKSTSVLDHFWKLRCRKSGRRCGETFPRCEKHHRCSDHFWTVRCRFAWQAQGIRHLAKSEQNVKVLSQFQKCWQAWDIWRGSAKMHFAWQAHYKRHVQIFRFAKMIVRDRCSTSYDLASLFRGRRSTLDRRSGKNANCIGTRPSALHSTFHFWRKSLRIASFLMLSTSIIEEVSQNCFVFDDVKLENCGSLAECLRFWCCQLRTLRGSRRIASFSSLQIDR